MRNLLTILMLAVFAGLFMGSTCQYRPGPMPVEPADTAMCAAACDHLKILGCEEGEDLPDGTTCEKFCIDTQKSGHALRPSCVVTIQSCEVLDQKCYSTPRRTFE